MDKSDSSPENLPEVTEPTPSSVDSDEAAKPEAAVDADDPASPPESSSPEPDGLSKPDPAKPTMPDPAPPSKPGDTKSKSSEKAEPQAEATSPAESDGDETEEPSDDKTTAESDKADKADVAGADSSTEGSETEGDETEGDEADSSDSSDSDPKADSSADDDSEAESSETAEAEDTKSAPASSDDKPPSRAVGEPVPALATPPKASFFDRLGNPKAVIVGAGVVALYLTLAGAWALDSMFHRDTPARGVAIMDVNVGGADSDEVDAIMGQLNQQLAESELRVEVDSTSLVTSPSELGAKLDDDAMVDAAMEARRGGFLPWRPISWFLGLFSTTSIDPIYTVEVGTAQDAVDDVLAPALTAAVEPGVDVTDGELAATEGIVGRTIDPTEITSKLLPALDAGEPFSVALATVSDEPDLDTADVQAVVDDLNESTAQAVRIRVLDKSVDVEPELVRTWLELDPSGDELGWAINEELALADLKPLFPTLGNEDQQAGFAVVDEVPIIIPASESVICCEAGAGEAIAAAIAEPIAVPEEPEEGEEADEEAPDSLRTVSLSPIITDADEGVAELESLGIVEQVSTFTTNHACCQNRVINIQRFADLTQGAIIRPGETFSFNDYVGRRTTEKGFVADGAIALGNFEKQVGGGISQYATTFFNASFFAGIEFVEYQSHSIYISRYPRGREATISWPRPDLEVLNDTPYGILIWNEYTPTSITVSFYSTKHLEVEALDRLLSYDRKCRIDITPRLVTSVADGSVVKEDRVFASYRPGEGLDCNGNSTTPEEDEPEETTTTVASPSTSPTTAPTTTPTTAATTPTTATNPPSSDEVLPGD